MTPGNGLLQTSNQSDITNTNDTPTSPTTSAAVAVAVSGDGNNGDTTLFSPNTNTMPAHEHIEELEANNSLGIARLILRGYLTTGENGKAHLTPKGMKAYVDRAIMPMGSEDIMFIENVNPFGFKCIDGRYKALENFAKLSELERVILSPGSVPGGGAGVLMALVVELLELYGTSNQNMIKMIMIKVLERNKERNPKNYKIRWHTDKHTEDKRDHTDGAEFKCGCGFLTNAFMKTEGVDTKNSYGLTNEMIDFVQSILHDQNWSESPEVLGANDKYLENHDERAAMIVLNFEDGDAVANFTIQKQVNFSEFLTEGELQEIKEKEGEEGLSKLNIMVFTANYRAFGQKISQLSEYATDIIMKDTDALASLSLTDEQKIRLANNGKYFVGTDKTVKERSISHLLIHSGIDRIDLFTKQIKKKIADKVPLVSVKIPADSKKGIIVTQLGE